MAHSSSPIHVDQFVQLLNTLWPRWSKLGCPKTLGIAVSGGVDSMALSYLCKAAKSRVKGLEFRALIIDHQIRQDSRKESNNVARLMRSLGLPSTIVRLRWNNDHLHHGQLRNFETEARKLRYRALGQACRYFNIRHLLLAHHENDQAETILLRILGGYVDNGLQGIRPEANFPECHGLYGVHASGSTFSPSAISYVDGMVTEFLTGSNNISTASGGVHLCRPLLGVPKESLRATCLNEKLRWFEDPTNHDLGLTIRNAVRYLLEADLLPKALRRHSLLQMSKKFHRRNLRQRIAARQLARKLHVVLDLRCGRAIVTIPSELPVDIVAMCAKYQVAPCRLAQMLTRNIASMVSCHEKSNVRKLANTSEHIFVQPGQASSSNGTSAPKSFTLSGVHWHLIHETPSQQVWSAQREPPSMSRPSQYCDWGSVSLSDCHRGTIIPVQEWQLFDNRWWIRFHHSITRNIRVSLMTREDLQRIRFMVKYDKKKRILLEGLLKEAAPGKIRWTLPVVSDILSGQILALPTLNINLCADAEDFKWQIMYKKLNLTENVTWPSILN